MKLERFRGELTDTARRQIPRSLYVHIPFCARRCYYCDFTVSVAQQGIGPYLEDLDREFRLLAATTQTESLKTVFVGGGTPTLLSAAELETFFGHLTRSFSVSKDAEITVEANPGTLNRDKLAVLRAFGVNRLSFGAQTFADELLQAIGRTHDAKAITESVLMARREGMERLSVDLMFGLPKQTLHDVKDSLQKLLTLDVGHVSAYWLKVEAHTPFAVWQKRGQLHLPGEDLEADMYEMVRETLEKQGLTQYEVSNFGRPGEASRHNLVYWRNEPYLAAGVGAHGYVSGVRYENVTQLKSYREMLSQGQLPVAEQREVSFHEACEDTMMLGLRLRTGVSERRFMERHGIPLRQVFGRVIDPLVSQGLLEWEADFVRLTDRAWPVANIVFEEFVATQSAD